MLTPPLLLAGILLVLFGTGAYVIVGMTDPDDETLRIAKTIARAGRWSAAAGLAIHFLDALIHQAPVSAPMDAATALAAAVLLPSLIITALKPRPQIPSPA
jgi:hypothetical protein